MVGINIDTLDSIISRTSESIDNYNGNSKDLSNVVDGLEYCYGGNCINFLFRGSMESLNQLGNIEKVLSNYIEVLSDVRKSYVKQNEIFSDQLSRVSSII